jgi:shikimate 5-dehydrogenase
MPDELAIPADWIRPGTLVLDAVYRPLRTPLLMEARKKGCTAVPGGEWFVRQAQAQFKLFTGQDPDEALMRAAFQNAYEEERAG